METATLGGGCFWCVEAVYQRTSGVRRVMSGYAAGKQRNPTYEAVCTGRTGHAEVVQIEFDEKLLSYADVLGVFWKAHDPTTPNRQGADVGTQYRSIICYHDDRQREIAVRSVEQAGERFRKPIVTEIVPLEAFYPAERYHQNYYNQNRRAGYCRVVIAPKLSKLGMPS